MPGVGGPVKGESRKPRKVTGEEQMGRRRCGTKQSVIEARAEESGRLTEQGGEAGKVGDVERGSNGDRKVDGNRKQPPRKKAQLKF